MAYWSPRKKPFVPSMGSSVQKRSAYCTAVPRSIQLQTASASGTSASGTSASGTSAPGIGARHVRLHAGDDLGERSLVLAQRGGVFFGDDGVVGEGGLQRAADERLAPEVGHGDGRAVVLFEGFAVDGGLHGAAEGGGLAHGGDGDGLFVGEASGGGGHGRGGHGRGGVGERGKGRRTVT